MLYDGLNKHKAIERIVLGGKQITKYYTIINSTARLLWEGIKSCFGSGWWINNKQWSNKEGWKN